MIAMLGLAIALNFQQGPFIEFQDMEKKTIIQYFFAKEMSSAKVRVSPEITGKASVKIERGSFELMLQPLLSQLGATYRYVDGTFDVIPKTEAVQELFSLRQVRHKGEVEKYHLVLDAPGTVVIRYESTESHKVTKIESNGTYTFEDSTISGSQTFGSQVTQFPKQDPTSVRFTALGELVQDPPPAGTEFIAVNELQVHLSEFVPPQSVKIGESWSHKSGLVSVECTLVGHEKLGKIDCLEIAMSMKLNKEKYPGSAKETIWLRAADFSLQKLDAMAEGAEYTSNQPMNMNKNHVTIDRL